MARAKRTTRKIRISPTKRERTKALLLDATVKILAEKGIDANTIVEIAALAGVANGTFYLHFKDRQAAIDEAIFEMVRAIGHNIELTGEAVADPVERAARNTYTLITEILAKPTWAQALMNSYSAMPKLQEYLADDMLKTLKDGIASGDFHAQGTMLDIDRIVAVIMALLRHELHNAFPVEPIKETVEIVLRMIGVGVERAHQVSQALPSSAR